MIGVFNFTFSLDESKFSWSDPCFCWLYPFKSEFSMEKSLLGTRRSSLWLQLRQLSKSLGRQIFQRCQDVQFRSAWAAGGMLLRKGMAIIIPSYPIHRICFHQHVYRLNKGNCDILCDQIYYSTYGILMGPLFVCFFLHCRVWLPKGYHACGINGESSQTLCFVAFIRSNVCPDMEKATPFVCRSFESFVCWEMHGFRYLS